jgi:hypothetical protein
MASSRPPLDTLLAAAKALARAGQWDLATSLLDSCDADDPRVLLVRASLAVWQDFWQATDGAGGALAAAAASTRSPDDGWQLDLLSLQRDYLAAVAGPDGTVRIGPQHHRPCLRTHLADRAARLRRSAPGAADRGWAAFWAGAIADNIIGDPAVAHAGYVEALAAGETTGDDQLVGEALRHLGVHARRRGDHDETGRLWHDATVLRQRAGAVPEVLSQLLALARHAADRGDDGRAAALAAEVHCWADTLRLSRLAAQAAGFRP